MSNHIIIYSHGFGVRKDDRGLFTDIAATLHGAQHILFDYNQADETTNTLTVAPLTKQAEKLRRVITDTQAANPEASIDLICHSQGCVVAAMVQPQGIHKVVFLAPPDHFAAVDQKIKKMLERPGTKLNNDGSTSYPRRDGSTTTIPKAYWDSRQGVNPMQLYRDLAGQTELTIVQADHDEVIGETDFSELKGTKVIHMNTGHDYEGQYRDKVASLVAEELELHASKARITIVNDQDEIIRYKERGTVEPEDIYRVSALWVTNSKGDILLAQRQLGKRHHPGMWGPAVAGTVDEGESYEENIIKEAAEEIGLKSIKPQKSIKQRVTLATGDHNHFTQWYTLVVDKPAEDFTIQEEEVEQVRWFTRSELKKELQDRPEKYLKGLKWAIETL